MAQTDKGKLQVYVDLKKHIQMYMIQANLGCGVYNYAQIYIPWQFNTFFFSHNDIFLIVLQENNFFVFLIQNLTFDSNLYFLFLLMTKIHQQFLRANIFKVNSTLFFF